MTAAIAGLSLNEAAYMAEIIRGGLLSVDKGQVEATDAFGMTRTRALRRIIIPQAMRSIIPPTGNQLISMIKATSLVSVIAMSDLLYSVQAVYNRTFEVMPMLMVAVIWYLIITSILNVGQGFIERYYARGERGSVRRQCTQCDPRRGAGMNLAAKAITPDTAEPLVRARNVHKSFGDNEVLKGIDLDVHAGRGGGNPRPVRVREIHISPLYQSSRGDRSRLDRGR